MALFAYRFERVLADAQTRTARAGRALAERRLLRDRADRAVAEALADDRSARCGARLSLPFLADLDRFSAALLLRAARARERVGRIDADLRALEAAYAVARRRSDAFARNRARALAAHRLAQDRRDEREADEANAASRRTP